MELHHGIATVGPVIMCILFRLRVFLCVSSHALMRVAINHIIVVVPRKGCKFRFVYLLNINKLVGNQLWTE